MKLEDILPDDVKTKLGKLRAKLKKREDKIRKDEEIKVFNNLEDLLGELRKPDEEHKNV